MSKIITIVLFYILLAGLAAGTAVIEGGWDVEAEGSGTSSGTSTLSSQSGDPTVTMGISSSSSLYGIGSISDSKTGSQSIDVTIMGYELSAAYDGDVSSGVILTSKGSAKAEAFIGATATGLSTGGTSHDIFGTADLTTAGLLNGKGSGKASANGSASYGVSKVGTPSEIWGVVTGESTLAMVGVSSSAIVGTSGAVNGLHTESRVTKAILGEISSSSRSTISAYASSLNSGHVNVTSSGTAQSGGWDPTFTSTKSKLQNENVDSSVTGVLTGYSETNGEGDSSDLSGVIEGTATKDNTTLFASGGVGTYTSTTQTSSAERGYTQVRADNNVWGSIAESHNGYKAVEWGNLTYGGSGAITGEAGTYALSFSKAFFRTDYTIGSSPLSTGNMSLNTYTEASYNKSAKAGAILYGAGDGTMMSVDTVMTNVAGFSGTLNHFSYIDSDGLSAVTRNIVSRAFVTSDPNGSLGLIKPFAINTTAEPDISWSATQGWYYQSH